MTDSPHLQSAPRRRPRPVSGGLLVVTVALASLLVDLSYGLALEYGDTAASDGGIAARSPRDWGLGLVLVAGLAGWTMSEARGSRARRTITVCAVAAVVVTLGGVPSGAVLGVHRKLDA